MEKLDFGDDPRIRKWVLGTSPELRVKLLSPELKNEIVGTPQNSKNDFWGRPQSELGMDIITSIYIHIYDNLRT